MEIQAEEEKNPDVHTDLISTFCEITSSPTEEALFFLESHNFHLDAAVSTFFETAAAAPDNPHTLPPPQSRSPSPSRTPSPSSSPSRSLSPSPPPSLGSHPNSYNLRSRQPMASSATNKRLSGSRSGAIRTLSDLNRPSRDGSGSDSDEPQEYYTGGEKSGMLVQDPSNVNYVDAIFTHARQKGAVEGPLDHLRPSSSSRSFAGTGRLLSGETVSAAPQQPEAVTHDIVFRRNGFTVDDGPLRRWDDPVNASFLESIKKSKRRKELEPADGKTSVHIPEERQPRFSFHGVGRTLGSTSSSTSTEPTLITTPLTTAPPTSMGLVVDDTLPSTSVQLRLADGTRMVSRFNHHHTIRDIRAFIDASRPSGARTYQLQAMGFPPKQLTDLDQSIEEAGLANSVVIQKL